MKNTLVGYRQTWKVRSGIPGSYHPIANGLYTVPKESLMAGTPGHGVPYDSKYARSPFSFRDKKGFSWFLWLGSGNLGVHPDGNVPGTKGCIGIIDEDTKPLFDAFKKLNLVSITILVK